MALILSQH